MQIKDKYIDERGNVYNIRNINYESLEEARFNFGTFLTESKSYKFDSIDSDLDGIYLYKTIYDPKKVLRIYKDYPHYKYISHCDQRIISELQSRQKNIKLTDFPTGVVTIENIVIGQEIPYYEGFETIRNIYQNNKYIKIPTYYYLEILKILKELFKEGIIYKDIHSNNFLYKTFEECIKLIDFEPFEVRFDEGMNCNYNSMIDNLKAMIILLNGFSGIEFDSNFKKTKTLEEVEESILENQKKLK